MVVRADGHRQRTCDLGALDAPVLVGGKRFIRLAYLTSRYPQVSHTFVQGEVRALRGLGVQVDTFAVRAARDDEVLSSSDREERARTTALRPVSPARLLAAHRRAFATAPGAYAGALVRALRGSPPGLRAPLWQLFYFAEAILLWQACAERGIRHVHVHFANVAADVAMIAAAFARAAGEPDATWSFTMHGPTEFYDVAAHNLAAKARSADLVVCISDFARSQVMRLLDVSAWSKLAIVHCGVDLERFPAVDRRGRCGEPIEVLCVARLVPEKGQSVLVESVADLRAAGVPVHCTLVGAGPSKAQLQRLVRDRGLEDAVTLTGAVGQDVIVGFYERADVFCLPSFAEGVPVVLMEAMSTQLPVVATHIAGVPELVEDGVSGRLVTPGSAEALTSALAELLADDDLRARLGRAGRARIEADFDVRSCARALRAALDGAVAGAGASRMRLG